MTVAAWLLWGYPLVSHRLRMGAWVGLCLSGAIYVFPGHAPLYGPHLVVLYVVDLAAALMRRRR